MGEAGLKRILYVDDDKDIRSLVAMALGVGGFDVKLCASGAEALTTAPAFAPDIILLDVMMPQMDGPATLVRLRENPVLGQTPIVFLTAASRDVGALRGLGAADVLIKPFDPMKLAEQVRAAWTRHTGAATAETLEPVLQHQDELQRSYIDNLPRKLKNLNELWTHLVHTDWSQDNLKKVITIAHTLKGSAASFGLPAIGLLAGTIEGQLVALRDAGSAPEGSGRRRIDDLLQHLGHLVGTAKAQGAPFTPAPTASSDYALVGLAAPVRRRHVYIAEDDGELAAWLALQLRQHGYLVETFRSPELLLRACEHRRPDAILSDIVFSGGENHGLTVIGTLLKKDPIPTLFLSGRVDLKARLVALRAGAAGYLMKPVDIGQLLSKLQDILGTDQDEPYRVLIVEDDEDTATRYSTLLRNAGMRCEVLVNPLKLMQPLLAFRPELILTDLHMPKINGFELAQLVRQEEAFANTPIIFLSADGDERHLVSSAVAGGDTFLTKSIAPNKLVIIVSSRLKRVRTVNRRIEYLAHRDSVSGVLNRAWFLEELERALLTSSDVPAALLFLSIDNFHVVSDQLQPMRMNQFIAEWAEVLREHLSESDLFGRFSDSCFMLYVHRPSREAIGELAHHLLAVGNRQQVVIGGLVLRCTLSIGVQRNDGRPGHTLVAAARFLARRARNADGAHVIMDEASAENQRRYRCEQLYLGAIRNDADALDSEFLLQFQPLVSLKGEGDVACYEARLGLYDAGGAKYPMREVAEVAKRHGLQTLLDLRLLERTLAALTEGPLRRGGEQVFLKVAVDALGDATFSDLLRQTAIDPAVSARVVLMVSYQGAWTNLERLKQHAELVGSLGFALAIDQFNDDDEATQLLGQLSPRYVKFDPAITRNLIRDSERAKALAEVVQKCHKRGIKVLASNEEHSSAMLYLTEIEVDYIQVNMLLEPGDHVAFEAVTVDEQSTFGNPIWHR